MGGHRGGGAVVIQTVDVSPVGALCVTHQRETFVCLDGMGRPLRPAMFWMYSRAVGEVDRYGTAEVHRTTGKPPNPTPLWYRLPWLRRHEPETLQRTGTVVAVQGLLLHRLTEVWATSWASADPLGLVNMGTVDHDDSLLSDVGLNRSSGASCTRPVPCSARSHRRWRRLSDCPWTCPSSPGSATAGPHSSSTPW